MTGPSVQGERPHAERLWPAADPRAPIDFLSIDALAAWFIRQARQRRGPRVRLRFLPFAVSDGGPPFAAQGAFALTGDEVAAFDADPRCPQGPAHDRAFLGFAAGPRGADRAQLEDAVARIQSGGSLAA